ncbi:exonuclease SbcCD subunit D [uncultured Ruegeria sp.]|uniref:metallophosphoesterase family protein n=1 Tax=uncultured Ruegeria sp. TaxID=259304 RepID=UPI0026257326|nr:exonuclease SbcCD subunit D [uncultured Ruegeria sp.]
MKILHTADWHLGRSLRGVSLLDDQAHILDQIFETIVSRNIDVLIVAGDIYDKASPPEAAVKLYSDFIERVYEETEAAIVVIAGNHDSGQRLGAVTKLFDKKRILIRGTLASNEPPLLLEDAHGPVAFAALPYGEIYAARRVFGDENIRTPEDVLRHQVDAARQQRPEGARWVIVAHAFVTDCQPSDSERRLAVGTVEMVSQSIFEGADYVALGHLHRPQTAGSDTIRYSGSPLAFGFDEADTQKTMTIFDLEASGALCNLEQIEFEPLRRVREVKGLLADLVAEAQANPSDDLMCAILLDEGALVEPAAQLRPFYPNILQTLREKKKDLVISTVGRAQSKLDDPVGVISEFVAYVRGEEPSETEQGVVAELLNEPVREEV